MDEISRPRGEGDGGRYFISATASLAEQRPRTLKSGDTFALFGHSGDATPGSGSAEGIYYRDTRYLSRITLEIGDALPILLSSAVSTDNAMLTCDLTNPALELGGTRVEHGQIHIRRAKFLRQGACHERLAIRNFSPDHITVPLTLQFAADFADVFEVRGTHRDRHGTVQPPKAEGGAVVFRYTGLDGLNRAAHIHFAPAPTAWRECSAFYNIELPPGAHATVELEIACREEGKATPQPVSSFAGAMRIARCGLREAQAAWPQIITDNELFNQAITRSVADLVMLVTDTEDGPYPYAGIPWFSTAFGRDAIITALQTMWLVPAMARGVLLYLAANQATEINAAADSEPGKILHEVRHGEMALLGEVPFRRYYGSVDSTPLFVVLAGAYFARTGDVETIRKLWPHVEAAIAWMDEFGDADGDGLVEYDRRTAEGLINQGWKDSFDSIFHVDGSLARGPIALSEVQAYVFAARRAAAEMALALGFEARAAALSEQARVLREHVEAAFWDDELGLYVLALDGQKQPCRVAASNAGHMLFAGLPDEARARAVAGRLLGRGFWTGWGIRTVASDAARYNPMSYHNGSVWPHDNSVIAAGFARYGLAGAATKVLCGLFDTAMHTDLQRLPELFCGFPRMRNQGPTNYPVACSPQAWAAGALPGCLAACLGVAFDPADRTVRFNRPVLPEFLTRVRLQKIELCGARIDILLHRTEAGAIAMAVTDRQGDIQAMMTS